MTDVVKQKGGITQMMRGLQGKLPPNSLPFQ